MVIVSSPTLAGVSAAGYTQGAVVGLAAFPLPVTRSA